MDCIKKYGRKNYHSAGRSGQTPAKSLEHQLVTYATVQVEVRTGVVEFEPGFVNRALRRNATQVAEQLLFVQASVRFNGVGAIFKTANPARAFEIHNSYSNSFVRGNDN